VRSDEWLVADEPNAAAAAETVAAAAGEAVDAFHPCFEEDPGVVGLALFARSPAARERFAAALRSGAVQLEYRAITPMPLWDDGWLEAPYRGKAAETRFERVATVGACCELALKPRGAGADAVRFHLAGAGLAILGDATPRGSAGPMRLRLARLTYPAAAIDARGSEPAGWWPAPPVRGAEGVRPVLRVSRATLRALERGHPWVLRDAETSDTAGLQPGALVDLRGRDGRGGGVARVEGTGRVAARLWSTGERMASVEKRVATALAKRRELLADDRIEALRLIHGEADALPGLAIDRLGPLLRVLVTGRACEPVLDRAVHAVVYQLADRLGGDPPVVRVVHLSEPPPGRLRAVALLRGTTQGLSLRDGRLRVTEANLDFWVDPGLADPYRGRPGSGLFLDQRDNRARVRLAAAGGRWLNLFCHTGGFSAAALAGGAREVISVDLSAPYLAWLDANLDLNGLDRERHRGVRMDVRRYLERLPPHEEFNGIVLDPPTAARAGRRFWSVRREGGALLEACLRRLRPGGTLLACRNDHALGSPLREHVAEAADTAGIPLEGVEEAPPAPDFPRLPGFPEGDAFAGVWVTRRG